MPDRAENKKGRNSMILFEWQTAVNRSSGGKRGGHFARLAEETTLLNI
jgi:hypothetical protein